MNIGYEVGIFAAGVMIGSVGTMLVCSSVNAHCLRVAKTHKIVLNAFSRAYGDILSESFRTKVYRRVKELVSKEDENIGVVVTITDAKLKLRR